MPDWEVEERAWQSLAGGLKLPDPDDVHVLGAALAGHTDCLVTANLHDFPIDVVGPFGIEIIHPDQFIVAQWDLDRRRSMNPILFMPSDAWQCQTQDHSHSIVAGGFPETS